MKRLIHIWLCIPFFLLPWNVPGQVVKPQPARESLINVHYSESGSNLLDSLISRLMGNVVLSKDSSFMYCDTAILKNRKILIAYGNVSILQSDTIQVFCDSLYFHADSSVAYLYNNVLLKNGSESMKTSYLEYNIEDRVADYFDGAVLRRDSKVLKSVRGRYFVRERKAEFFQDVQVTDTSFHLWTDTLYYNMRTEKVEFTGPTRIHSDDGRIYCEYGLYFLDDEDGYFEKNAQYLKEDIRASADQIFYHGELKDVVLEGNAMYIEEDKTARAVKIVFNEETENAVLTGDAFFKDDKREITADVIIYNAENETTSTKGRVVMREDSTELQANHFYYDGKAGRGEAEGEVKWQDFANDLEVLCDSMNYKEQPEEITLFGKELRPLLKSKSAEDTVYLAADTLWLVQKVDSLDTIKLFIAIQDVRVLSKDILASTDSLIYNLSDSTYSLFKNPYIWSDTVQFSADTIQMWMHDSEIDRIHLRNRSFVITENKEKVYDQIKGKNVDIQFTKGELQQMFVKGSAESIYYIRDDAGDFLGINKTECSSMRFLFEDEKLNDIKFLSNPTSKMIPINSSGRDPLKLDGFNWNGRRKTVKIDEMRKQTHESA